MRPDANVAAVIVTYNNIALLKRCVEALLASSFRPAEIIIVNNASKDGTADWLVSQSGVSVVTLDENLGGAGGFHAGMLHALRRNPDWIWLMDDDCIVQPDSLERLLIGTLQSPKGSFYSSLALWTDGIPCRMNIPPTAWEWTDSFAANKSEFPLAAASFVSCLVRTSFVRAVGLPVKEFFIWFDDFEYTRRLAGIAPGYLVPSSIVTHETKFNRGVDWGEVDRSNVWKYKRGIRNELALIVRNEQLGFAKACIRFWECLARARKGPADWKTLSTLFGWGFRGLFWDYRKCIRSANQLLNQREVLLTFEGATVKTKNYPDCDWLAVWGNNSNIMTHPPAVGASESQAADVIFKVKDLKGLDSFHAVVSLFDVKSQPVDFVFELRSADNQLLQRAMRTVTAEGGYTDFNVRMNSNLSTGGYYVRLYALMSSQSTTNAFASAIWTVPCVCSVSSDKSVA